VLARHVVACRTKRKKEIIIPRQPRQLSETGLYHVMFRGVNHCLLFEEPEDYHRLLSLIDRAKTELDFEILAYCLMSNHTHLLIKEKTPGDITQAMRKVLAPYAIWFNKKYERSGTLITNRYKSEPVTADSYLIALIRYIHNNPLNAGIATTASSYPWSSYTSYTASSPGLVNTELVLSMLAPDRSTAITEFRKLHSNQQQETINTLQPTRRKDQEIRFVLADAYGGLQPNEVNGLPKSQRDTTLAFLRSRGFSIRQIERVTGVPRGIIARSKRSENETM